MVTVLFRMFICSRPTEQCAVFVLFTDMYAYRPTHELPAIVNKSLIYIYILKMSNLFLSILTKSQRKQIQLTKCA